MRVVIDTNILVSALSSFSKYHWLIQALVQQKFTLLVNHEIILEYEEILKKKYHYSIAEQFIKSLTYLSNVETVTVYFNWQLLKDVDDNKYVDVYLAGNANFLITEDSDFRVLKQVIFPRVTVLGIQDFEKMLV